MYQKQDFYLYNQLINRLLFFHRSKKKHTLYKIYSTFEFSIINKSHIMKNIYLFPNKLKIPALMFFLISLFLIILQYSGIKTEITTTVFAFISDGFALDSNVDSYFLSFVKEDIYNEILDCVFFISGSILAFSKEKIEDELITFIRFKSLVYATYFTILLLVLSEIFIYGWAFLGFLMIYFYSFILFLNIFYYTKLFIYKKQFSYENED